MRMCGTNSAYLGGCRCEPCVVAHNRYQRDYYARNHRTRPAAGIKSFWDPGEQTRRRQERLAEFKRLAASAPCIRCDMRGSGYPLCTICLGELRGERVAAGMPNDLWVENAIPLIAQIIKARWSDGAAYDQAAIAQLMREVEDERVAYQLAGNIGVPQDQLDGWRRQFVDYLGTVLEVLPVR